MRLSSDRKTVGPILADDNVVIIDAGPIIPESHATTVPLELFHLYLKGEIAVVKPSLGDARVDLI
jgi:hypothetical protein